MASGVPRGSACSLCAGKGRAWDAHRRASLGTAHVSSFLSMGSSQKSNAEFTGVGLVHFRNIYFTDLSPESCRVHELFGVSIKRGLAAKDTYLHMILRLFSCVGMNLIGYSSEWE